MLPYGLHMRAKYIKSGSTIIHLKVGCHGLRMCTEIYCRANLTLNLRVDSEYVVA